jgi:hypothetical protein
MPPTALQPCISWSGGSAPAQPLPRPTCSSWLVQATRWPPRSLQIFWPCPCSTSTEDSENMCPVMLDWMVTLPGVSSRHM